MAISELSALLLRFVIEICVFAVDRAFIKHLEAARVIFRSVRNRCIIEMAA